VFSKREGEEANGAAGAAAAAELEANVERMYAIQHVMRCLRFEPVEWMPFVTGSLPEPCAGYVRGVAEAVGCDEAYVALPLLAALAGAVGNARSVRIGRDWEEPAVVWAVIVGESGAIKTPAFNLALRPVYALQTEWTRAHVVAAAEYRRQLRACRNARWQRSMQIARGANPADAAAIPEPAAPEAPPPHRRVLANDISLDLLVELLARNPRGILVARDELSGWFASFDSRRGRRGNDVAHWLSMFNAGAVTLERRRQFADGVTVPRAAVSIAGTIQPEVFFNALRRGQARDGLSARFLTAYPPRHDRPFRLRPLSARLVQSMDDLFRRLSALEPSVSPWGEVSPQQVRFAPDGRDAWDDYYFRWARHQAHQTGDAAAFAAKTEAYAARLALLFQLVRGVMGQGDPERIDAESMQCADTVASWCCRESRRVMDLLEGVRHENDDSNLVRWIRKRGGVTTLRDLMRGPREFRTRAAAEEALDSLERLELGVWRDGPSERTPASEFALFQWDS
jgi:hypothetical protein